MQSVNITPQTEDVHATDKQSNKRNRLGPDSERLCSSLKSDAQMINSADTNSCLLGPREHVPH